MMPITVPITIEIRVAAQPDDSDDPRTPHDQRQHRAARSRRCPAGKPAVGGLIGSPVACVTLMVLGGNSTGAKQRRAG